MFAFVDETGNTGSNIFDEDQPILWIGAMMTPHDFDLNHSDDVASIIKAEGLEDLHATELGLGGLERIAKPLRQIMIDAGAKFFYCRIVKRDMAAFKFFDTFFDPGENKALMPHHYNMRPLRLMLLVKVYCLLDDDLLATFWDALVAKRWSFDKVAPVLEEVRDRSVHLPDARSQQLVSDAMSWAIDHPNEIEAGSYSKFLRQSHMPNMVAFTGLMRGIDEQSKEWKQPVKRVTHDRQDQFRSTMLEWHKTFSNAAAGTIHLPFEGEVGVQLIPGSEFFVEADSTRGLDTIDVALWLIKRYTSGTNMQGKCERLRRYVMANARYFDMSIGNIERTFIGDALTMDPVTLDRLPRAKWFLDKQERERIRRMNE